MICKKCGKDKQLKKFNKNQDWCRTCTRQYGEEYRDKLWEDRKPYIEQYLGTECYLCGGKNNLHTHEKYGRKHKPLLRTLIPQVIKNLKVGKFVNLCPSCHGTTTELMRKGKKWKEISRLLFVPRQFPLPIEVESPQPTSKPEIPYVYRGVPRIVGSLLDESGTTLVYPDELDDREEEPDVEALCF